MILSLLTAASAMALPVPDNDEVLDALDRSPLSLSDFDLSAYFLLFVDPEGDVLECTAQNVEGIEAMAARVCRELRRSDARPGKGPDGAPIHGIVATRITILRDRRDADEVGYVEYPDLMLPMPSTEFSGLVNTLVEVDASGRIVHCEARLSLDDPSEEDNAKVCDFLKTVPVGTMNGKAGVPVPYVRSIKVYLNAEAGA